MSLLDLEGKMVHWLCCALVLKLGVMTQFILLDWVDSDPIFGPRVMWSMKGVTWQHDLNVTSRSYTI